MVSVATLFRIRKFVPFAYDSIEEIIICNVELKLRGLKFKTVTSDGNSECRVLIHLLYILMRP